MKKWEYKLVAIHGTKALNKEGEQGWEAIWVQRGMVLLKREISEEGEDK